MKYFVIVILISIAVLSGCYYDDPDVLDPNRLVCDTSIVTYSGSVSPVLMGNCTSCHSGPNAANGIKLDTRASVLLVGNARLLGAINHSAGYSPMPKNGTKLTDCSIAKIRIWLDNGAPPN
jgi:hypothetical protein